MIDTSAEYRTLIKQPKRQLHAKVEIYFNGESATPAEFTEDDYIIEFNLLEEAISEGENPLGYVTSNEMSLVLANKNQVFTKDNETSPYYGNIKSGKTIKLYLGLLVGASYEYIPLGIFKAGEWKMSNDKSEVEVLCYDKAYYLFRESLPSIKTQQNTTTGGMFATLFESIGLGETEYEIDERLNQEITVGWFEGDSIGDALQNLADASFASVNVDRYGKLIVSYNALSGDVQDFYTDEDTIIELLNPQNILDVYSIVKVSYAYLYEQETKELIAMKSLVIPNGGETISEINFKEEDIPVFEIDDVILEGAVNSYINSFEFGANNFSVEIANADSEETVDLLIRGKGHGRNTSLKQSKNESAANDFGERVMKINNPLIQSSSFAQSYANRLLIDMSDSNSEFIVNHWGDMSLEIGDLISVADATNKVDETTVKIYRNEISYDGFLTERLVCKRTEPNYIWALIAPAQAVRILTVRDEQTVIWGNIGPGQTIRIPT